jgi:hypothetical protein
VFDCWRKSVQSVSGSFQPFMTRKESKKLGSFPPRQLAEFVIQSTIRSSQMGLDRSKHSRRGAYFTISVSLTVEMVEVSPTS